MSSLKIYTVAVTKERKNSDNVVYNDSTVYTVCVPFIRIFFKFLNVNEVEKGGG